MRSALSPAAHAAVERSTVVARTIGSLRGSGFEDHRFALTFDDGPDGKNTPLLLSVLAERQTRATFFVILEQAMQHRGLVDEILEGGHEIGLHGGRHIDLTRTSLRGVVSCVRGASRQLSELVGRPITLFRPPYGAQGPFSYAVARMSGMQVVAWTASMRDWLDIDPSRQTAVAMSELSPGGILLMHDGPPANPQHRAALLAGVLDAAAQRGWAGVSVGELLHGGQAARQVWFRDRAAIQSDELAPFALGSEP